MALHINEETIARLEEGKAWSKLSDIQKAAWERALAPYIGQFKPFAEEAAQSDPRIGKVGKPFIKAMIEAFGVRDPKGEPVLDAGGNRMSVPSLRITKMSLSWRAFRTILPGKPSPMSPTPGSTNPSRTTRIRRSGGSVTRSTSTVSFTSTLLRVVWRRSMQNSRRSRRRSPDCSERILNEGCRHIPDRSWVY